jgi:hypothetical protein
MGFNGLKLVLSFEIRKGFEMVLMGFETVLMDFNGF